MGQGLSRPGSDAVSGNHFPEHVKNDGEELDATLQKDVDYFQVLVNEMYLTYARKWFSTYDPMVLVVSDFIYDKEQTSVPFVVGPVLMEKYMEKVPQGMVFSDTRVAGLHPYRGGSLALAVVLCSIQRDNYARKLLELVEGAANVLDFSTVLSTYMKVANVILDGVEALLGLNSTTPVVGLRKQFNPGAGGVRPGYFALINASEGAIKEEDLWVRDRKLLYGSKFETARPFRDADYVLYSITKTPKRDDLSTLPFYPLWERVRKEAMIPKEDPYLNAKANMTILAQDMMLSPDLTEEQANDLADEYSERMKTLHDSAVKRAQRAPGEEVEPSELDRVRSKALSILRL